MGLTFKMGLAICRKQALHAARKELHISSYITYRQTNAWYDSRTILGCDFRKLLCLDPKELLYFLGTIYLEASLTSDILPQPCASPAFSLLPVRGSTAVTCYWSQGLVGSEFLATVIRQLFTEF